MAPPISPGPVTNWPSAALPAYVGNGVVGLRVPWSPLAPGLAILNGFAGRHPTDGVESFARAPYPTRGDVRVGSTSASDSVGRIALTEQRYDFGAAQLRTRLRLDAETAADIEVVTFCSRTSPTLTLQEVTVTVDRACDLELVAGVDPTGVPGHCGSRTVDVVTAQGVTIDGSMTWHSFGDVATCGAAYTTELIGADDVERTCERDRSRPLATHHRFRARRGQRYRLRQITSLVPDSLHDEPEKEAIRLAWAGGTRGFERIEGAHRAAWDELWKGRVELVGAPKRWQALTDAGFYYLHSSAHASSPSSTSMFGLASWTDYHYYRGHVMWDIDAFAVPPLLLTDPGAAQALLRFRTSRLQAARQNAALNGRRGAQYPWEASPRHGHEAAPAEGSAAAFEDHVSLDVGLALLAYVDATGDRAFARSEAWPALNDIAVWLESRIRRRNGEAHIEDVNGVAETVEKVDDNAFVNAAAIRFLRGAHALGRALGQAPTDRWLRTADGIVIPRAGDVILNHAAFDPSEEKAETPEAAAALFPLGLDVDTAVEQATLEDQLSRAKEYAGAPMLSPLLGVYAAWLGDRELALELFERGFGDFTVEPFTITAEYAPAVFPEQTVAGPFTANLGGFLMACLYGLPGLRLSGDDPSTWARRRVALPAGWDAICVEQVQVRGERMGFEAGHGDERARLVALDGPGSVPT
jgi:trehalose/maltose hydrolase-like predicted phosphorylase